VLVPVVVELGVVEAVWPGVAELERLVVGVALTSPTLAQGVFKFPFGDSVS
jgi:hypothetical protein